MLYMFVCFLFVCLFVYLFSFVCLLVCLTVCTFDAPSLSKVLNFRLCIPEFSDLLTRFLTSFTVMV